MRRLITSKVKITGIVVFAFLTMVTWTYAQSKAVVQYEGKWEIQANGDVKVTRQYKLPMQYYQMWKDADMHMLEFRSFAPDRSAIEVEDMAFKWNDMGRTLTLSMVVLGLARNSGDHWEAKILAGEEFSNLDETKKIAYFHFSMDGPMGRIQGQDRIILSPESSNPSWNPTNRTINYEMPEFSSAGSIGGTGKMMTTVFWVLFVACMLAGLVFWSVSFTLKSPAENS